MNAQRKDGSTALIMASQQGHEEIIRLLKSEGAKPLQELGPLPENESSEYLDTKSTGIALNWKEGVAQYSMMLSAKRRLGQLRQTTEMSRRDFRLPFRAYLEVYFENPADSNNPIVVSKVWEAEQQDIFFLSPSFKGLKCRNYKVVVYVYKDSEKSKFLGVHQQNIQSRVNLDKIKSVEELFQATSQGNCP